MLETVTRMQAGFVFSSLLPASLTKSFVLENAKIAGHWRWLPSIPIAQHKVDRYTSIDCIPRLRLTPSQKEQVPGKKGVSLKAQHKSHAKKKSILRPIPLPRQSTPIRHLQKAQPRLQIRSPSPTANTRSLLRHLARYARSPALRVRATIAR